MGEPFVVPLVKELTWREVERRCAKMAIELNLAKEIRGVKKES
jgi:hypothetical protein